MKYSLKVALAGAAAAGAIAAALFAAPTMQSPASKAESIARGSSIETASIAPDLSETMALYHRDDEVEFPEENPYSDAKAHLGKNLFFDPRLSRSGMQSCASCHNPSFAWGDGLKVGVGDHMKKLGRRTPTILNLAWAEPLMWDGRAETLEDQALGPIQAGVEMNMPLDQLIERLDGIDGYKPLFAAAFDGDATIAPEKIAVAIATYERTVVSGRAPFDRWIEGDETAISDNAKRGFELFNGKARCAACHEGWRFTDDSFHDIGLLTNDPGRGKHFPDVKVMQHAFKTPTLRNVAQRAPYMHAGQAHDLRAVVEHYSAGGIQRPSLSPEMKPLYLSNQDIDDLVAFMHTLSSEDEPVTLVSLPR